MGEPVMKTELYKMAPCRGLPCQLETFTIKGKKAYQSDFGYGCDNAREDAEDYACGDWYFTANDAPDNGVLETYNINLDEYKEICEALEKVLYVGNCGWCV